MKTKEMDVESAIEIIAVANFLGDEMTDDQAERLMDQALELSIEDRERVLDSLNGGPLYTAMSMHNGEMGGMNRY